MSPRAIARARQRADEAGVQVNFLEADLTALPDLGGPFDFLFDRGCYHAVRRIDVEPYLEVVRNSLKPGAAGLILAGKPMAAGKHGPPVVTEDELRAELGRIFEIVRLREFGFDEPPGSNERWLGWSCWVRRPRAPHPG